MSHVVLDNPSLDGARIVVHVDALREHLARGWELVGPCADRTRDPLLSDDEQLLADEAARDAEAALAAQAEAADLVDSTDDPENPASTDEDGTTTTLDQES